MDGLQTAIIVVSDALLSVSQTYPEGLIILDEFQNVLLTPKL